MKRNARMETEDFYSVPANRLRIFEREQHQCFYCLFRLTPTNRVIDRIDPGQKENNTCRNVVAACRSCNRRKKRFPSAEDFIRWLNQDGLLDRNEVKVRLAALNRIREGE